MLFKYIFNFLVTNNILDSVILLVTAIVLYISFREIRKQTNLLKSPVLRLQWTDKGISEYFSILKKLDENKYWTYTDLELINVGQGPAKDIIIYPIKLGNEVYNLSNVTVKNYDPSKICKKV